MIKKTIPFMFICLLLVGCSFLPSSFTPDAEGKVFIQASNLPSSNNSSWTAHILLIRGKHELREVIEVNGDNFTTTMSIPAGTWDISLHLVDNQGVINYQDTLKDITIHPHENTELNFQLRPANGNVQVLIDLSCYPDSEQILRVRIHFNEEIKEIIRSHVNDPFIGEYSLSPGSYDFKVELFTESFRVGDKVDPGVWEVIHIEPLSDQNITWSPFMEELTISADILTIPEAPSHIQSIFNKTHVSLEWTPSSSNNVTAYQIYCQITPFERFQLLATVNAHTLQFVHDLSEFADLPKSITYCVEAVADDIVSYRSPVTEVLLK